MNIGCLITAIALMRGFYSEAMDKILLINGHGNIYGRDAHKLVQSSLMSERYITKSTLYRMLDNSAVNLTFMKEEDIKFLLKNCILEEDYDTDGVYVGKRIADYMHLKIGDTIQILHDNYQIKAIFEIGFFEFDKHLVFVPKSTNCITSNEQYSVYLKDSNQIDIYKSKVVDTGLQVYVETWYAIYKTLHNMMRVNARGIMLLIGVFILSGSVQSITTLLLLIYLKRDDLIIMQDMGMTRIQKFKFISGYATCVNLSNILFGFCFGFIIIKSYVFTQDFLDQYFKIKVIDPDSFWIAKFNPKIYFFDVCIACIYSFVSMNVITLCFSYYYSIVNHRFLK